MEKKYKLAALLVTAAAIAPASGYAQSLTGSPTAQAVGDPQARGGGNEVNEVVVTATRRATALQTTPIAVTALVNEDLVKQGVNNADALMRVVPSVQVVRNVGAPAIYIRGIGLQGTVITSEAGVAVHLNGIYLARPESVDAAFFDLQQVEVLRGPQGTLYGRNATGGAINFITARPSNRVEANASLEIGNYNYVRSEAVVSGPIAGGLKGRLAGFFDRRDGYTTNLSTGKPLGTPRSVGGRLTLVYEPEGSNLSSTLVADYLSNTRSPITFRVRNQYPEIPGIYIPSPRGRISSDPREVYTDVVDPYGALKVGGVSLTNTLSLGAAEIKSITGYRNSLRRQSGDIDGNDAPNNRLERRQRSNTFSQELQIVSNNSSLLQYLIGAFYFHEHAIGDDENYLRPNMGSLANPVLLSYRFLLGDDQETNSYAGYGELSYQISDEIKAIAGIRYSKDCKTDDAYQVSPELRLNVRASLKQCWSAVTPKFVLQYRADNLFLYASATRGFKAGGFNNVQNPGYDPEFIWTYEVGAKRDWMQGALRTNLALFSSHYSDLQVTQFISNRAVLSNAAKSNISGFELETILHPASGLNISANVNYLDAKYKKSDPVFSLRDPVTRNFVVMTGKRMPFAPKLAYSIGADYSIPAAFLHGDVNFNATYTWRSAVHLDSLGQPTETQKSFGLLDLRAAWTRADGNVEVAVYARNVTNRVYYQQLLRASALTGGSTGVVGDPRTYGVRVAVKYN